MNHPRVQVPTTPRDVRVLDTQTGNYLPGNPTTFRVAARKADRLDKQYGAVRYMAVIIPGGK